MWALPESIGIETRSSMRMGRLLLSGEAYRYRSEW
jgi:hypothetical protein